MDCVLYALVGWSSLLLRRLKHWYLLIHKCISGLVSPYLQKLTELRSSSNYSLCSWDFLFLSEPRVQKRNGLKVQWSLETKQMHVPNHLHICRPFKFPKHMETLKRTCSRMLEALLSFSYLLSTPGGQTHGHFGLHLDYKCPQRVGYGKMYS